MIFFARVGKEGEKGDVHCIDVYRYDGIMLENVRDAE